MKALEARRAQELFESAIELPASQRLTYIDQATADDQSLHQAVLDLIEADYESGGFLNTPILVPRLDPPEVSGYRIAGVIGRGGMSTVYLAYPDADPSQPVAIKVLRAEYVNSSALLRFEFESEVLDRLEHRSIVKVERVDHLNDGRPYIVMEFIDGITITEYCDRSKASVKKRIKLFLNICAVVAHAHRHLIVHRDLKPGNILVDGSGRLVLLDFGIAKQLVDAHDLTEEGERVLTRNYASPEQLLGGAITTLTDVYSLGVVLFEILCGRRPHELAGLPVNEAARRLRIQDAQLMSQNLTAGRVKSHDGVTALQRVLQGDLDVIAAKALEYESRDRYASVDALADDLERYLDGRPIRARSLGFLGRSWKWVRRRPTMTTFVTLAILAICGFALRAQKHARIAQMQEQQARSAMHRYERVTELVTKIFDLADPYSAEEKVSSITLMEQASILLSTLEDDPETRAAFQHSLALICFRLGAHKESERLVLESLAMRRQLNDEVGIAESLLLASRFVESSGAFEDGLVAVDEAYRIRSRLWGSTDPRTAEALMQRGRLHGESGNLADAVVEINQAISLRMGFITNIELADDISTLTELNYALGRYEDAEAAAREAYALRQAALPTDHPLLAQAMNNLGAVLWAQGQVSAAEHYYRDALDLRRRILPEKHPLVANSLNNLANLLNDVGRPELASEAFEESLSIYRNLYGNNNYRVSRVLVNLALVQSGEDGLQRAETLLREAITINRDVLTPEHTFNGEAFHQLGDNLRQQGRVEEAGEYLQQALFIRVRGLGCDHPATASSRYALGRLYQTVENWPASEMQLREALEVRRKLLGSHWLTGLTLMNLAEVMLGMNQNKSALEYAREATQTMSFTVGDNHWRTALAHCTYARILARSGNESESRAIYHQWVDQLPASYPDIAKLKISFVNDMRRLDMAQLD